jgi:DNA-binding protein Fis
MATSFPEILDIPVHIEPYALLKADIGNLSLKEILQISMSTIEQAVLSHVLEITHGNKAQAARLLRIDYKTIHTKIKQYGILREGARRANN